MTDTLKTIYKALDDKKAIDIKIIDISRISVIADYFVVAGGNNINQVQALCDNVKEEMDKLGINCKNIEGYSGGSWILMDYGDIVIHIFNQEERRFYDFEKVWADGTLIEL